MQNRSQHFLLGVVTLGMAALLLGSIWFLQPLLKFPSKVVTVHFRHEDGMTPIKRGSLVLLGNSVVVGRVVHVAPQMVSGGDLPPGKSRLVFVVKAEIDSTIDLWGDCQITTDQPALGGPGALVILSVGSMGVRPAPVVEGLPPQSLQMAISGISRRLLQDDGIIDRISDALDPELERSAMHKTLAILDDIRAVTREVRAQTNAADQSALLAKIHGILDNVNATTASLRAEAAANNDAGLLAKFTAVADVLRETLGEIQALVLDERPRVRDTMTHLADASRTLSQDILGPIRAEMRPDDPATLLGKAHRAMDEANAALASASETIRTGELIVKLNRPKVEQAIDHVVNASRNLENLVVKILLNPRAVFALIPGNADDAQQAAFLAARNFADAATQLNGSAARLAALLDSANAGRDLSPAETDELRGIQKSLRESFDRFQQVEQALLKQIE